MDVTRTIRTSRHNASRPSHEATSASRLIARIVRECHGQQQFESYADLKDAVKVRLARLRIRYRPAEFIQALNLIESNTALVRVAVNSSRKAALSQGLTSGRCGSVLSRRDAAQLVEELTRNHGVHVRQMVAR
jgi:hypothetical protein